VVQLTVLVLSAVVTNTVVLLLPFQLLLQIRELNVTLKMDLPNLAKVDYVIMKMTVKKIYLQKMLKPDIQ